LGKTFGQLGKTSSESIMKVGTSEISKRDELHETPLALQSNCEAKRAPSTREIRFASRQARANVEQASHDKVNTARTSELRPGHDIDVGARKDVSPRPNVQVLQHHKTFTPVDQPEQHHSGLIDLSRVQSPSSEGDLRTEFCSKHATRETNLSSLKREPEKPIKFPSPSDPGWKEIDAELEIAIPMVFTKALMNKRSISQLSENFLRWIHAFFTERFGVKEIALKKTARREQRGHEGLARFRRQKQQLTKAKKALLKAGHRQDSRAMQVLSKTWREVMRQHNRLRLAVMKNLKRRKNRAAENNFKKNPAKYAEKLFKGAEQSAAPTFSKETCQEYFGKTYRDEDRSYVYTKLEGMIRPGLPKKAFDMRPPTVEQLCRSAKRKRNGAAPGLDAIGYVPFKKCRALIKFVHRMGIKIFEKLEVADDWAQAVVALLKTGSLTEGLDIVSEFRPITMTACIGKILLSVISDRLQVFMVKNSYIPRKIQKGFLSGIAGCVEHSFMLFEAMKEAKEEQRQIVVSWIDLANAYGSVRHNLIQFAMEWFHVPKEIQKLIFNYYEKLMAKVKTKEWTSGFFLFDTGLFQGCVLSTILFLCVFQMLLDFLKPLREEHGFQFKQADLKLLAEAYADDLAQVTKTVKGNQICCDATDKWLEWTKTMRAKPVKCISWGMKRFCDYKSEKFESINGKTYSHFDPKLTIAGKEMNFIINPNGDAFKDRHFKFLGRQVRYDLNKEHEIKEKIFKDFETDVSKVAKDPVNGLMKLWLYQFGIRLRMTWPLMIHDLDLTFATKLQNHIQPLLKEWASVGKTVDPGILYRAYDHLGLQITSMADHYKSSQLVKAQLLKYSVDESVRKVWQSKEAKEAKMTRRFKVSQLGTVAEAQVQLDLQYPSQSGRQGLGHGNYKANRTKAEVRKQVSVTANSFAEDTRMAHAHALAHQGAWTNWCDLVAPADLSWRNLIYGPGPHVFKFILNATVNWLKSPDMMKIWGYKKTAYCPLCKDPQCTLHHIISGCSYALNQGRYTHLAARLHPRVYWTSGTRTGRQSERDGAGEGHDATHKRELCASRSQTAGQTAQEQREQSHAAERDH
jgi:hypothetical protein